MDDTDKSQVEILVGPDTITEVYGHAVSVVRHRPPQSRSPGRICETSTIGVQGAAHAARDEAASWEESRRARFARASGAKAPGFHTRNVPAEARTFRSRRANPGMLMGFLMCVAVGTAALIWLLWEMP